MAPEQEPDNEAHMEIHCAAKDEVLATIAAAGGTVVREEEDRWAGDHWQSFHFAVTRQ